MDSWFRRIALITALNRLLSEPALPRRMGEAGRHRVDEYLPVKRVLDTYKRTIDSPREKLPWLRAKENL